MRTTVWGHQGKRTEAVRQLGGRSTQLGGKGRVQKGQQETLSNRKGKTPKALCNTSERRSSKITQVTSKISLHVAAHSKAMSMKLFYICLT